MSEAKKSFLLYSDMIGIFSKLPDDKAGQLIKHIFEYVNGKNPESDDLIIQIAFEPIKNSLEINQAKYHAKCEKNKENIKKRWENKNTNVYDRIDSNTNEYEPIPSDTKHTDTDTGIDTDTDTDILNNNIIVFPEQAPGIPEDPQEISKSKSFDEFWEAYPARNGKKAGKAETKKKFFSINPKHYPRIIQNARNYGINNEFPKDPVRFLKLDFWKDWDLPMAKSEASSKGKSFAKQDQEELQKVLNQTQEMRDATKYREFQPSKALPVQGGFDQYVFKQQQDSNERFNFEEM